MAKIIFSFGAATAPQANIATPLIVIYISNAQLRGCIYSKGTKGHTCKPVTCGCTLRLRRLSLFNKYYYFQAKRHEFSSKIPNFFERAFGARFFFLLPLPVKNFKIRTCNRLSQKHTQPPVVSYNKNQQKQWYKVTNFFTIYLEHILCTFFLFTFEKIMENFHITRQSRAPQKILDTDTALLNWHNYC